MLSVVSTLSRLSVQLGGGLSLFYILNIEYRTRNFEQQKYLKAVINVFHFDILRFLVLRFCGSYSLLDKGFHLYLVSIGANGDGPVMVGTVGFCSQGTVAFQNSPGGQMERVAKADGEYCNSGLKPM